jgi:hypothetical protein
LVTLATPSVVADSNGLFHGLGDHAENSFSVDGRVLETPFNENLILASLGASNPVLLDVIGGARLQAPIRSSQRNQFNAGFQQALGKFLVVDADYLWKYTHNAYDFSTFGNTPIFFPIAWKNSKIDGPSVRVSLPNYHRLTALAHVRARYFPPQVGGLGATVTGGEVFRIDHDQAFNQTTHFQYQSWKTIPWIGFNWRYDSGLVASNPSLDNFGDASSFLDADQQTAIGLFCVDAGGGGYAHGDAIHSSRCRSRGHLRRKSHEDGCKAGLI